MSQVPAEFLAEGLSIDYTPSSAKVGGVVVVQGKLVGVCKSDIPANVMGALAVVGVFRMPKDSSNITGAGLALYWDTDGNPVGGTEGTGCVTTTATGNAFCGWSLGAAGGSVGTVDMLLRSVNDTTSIGLDNLSDVGTISHTETGILVADGTKFEEVVPSGFLSLAATGATGIAVTAVTAIGSTQADAAALSEGLNVVAGANATKGVKLPAAAAKKVVLVKNNANAVLHLYPATDDAVNALAANASLDMAAFTSVILIAADATTWYTIPLLPS